MLLIVFLFLDGIKVKDLPSLIGSIMFAPDNDLTILIIFSTMDIKDLTTLNVDQVLSYEFEDLPPS